VGEGERLARALHECDPIGLAVPTSAPREHELDRHAQVRAIAEAGKQFALERLKMENVYC
jgi:hypothetical protein